MPYVLAIGDGEYVTVKPFSSVTVLTGGELSYAHIFDGKPEDTLEQVRKLRPEAKYVEVVVNSNGTVRLGTKMMQPKFVDPRREEAWMAIQELRAFAMACDADERSIQPHEILDRLPTRGY